MASYITRNQVTQKCQNSLTHFNG